MFDSVATMLHDIVLVTVAELCMGMGIATY